MHYLTLLRRRFDYRALERRKNENSSVGCVAEKWLVKSLLVCVVKPMAKVHVFLNIGR